MTAKKRPTPEQEIALAEYQAKHGHFWKRKLMEAWQNGTDTSEPNGHLLRQVRNNLGPTWLSKY